MSINTTINIQRKRGGPVFLRLTVLRPLAYVLVVVLPLLMRADMAG